MALTSAERLVVLRDLMLDEQSPHRALALSAFIQRNADGVFDDLLALDALRAGAVALCDAIDRAEGLPDRVKLRVPPDMMAAYTKLRALAEVK